MGNHITTAQNVIVSGKHVITSLCDDATNLLDKAKSIYTSRTRAVIKHYTKPIDEIRSISISSTDEMTLNENDKNIALIICNSYHNTRLNLGDPAINDGLLAYYSLNNFNYKCFLIHDPCMTLFRKSLDKILSFENVDNVVIYYIGHGSQVVDLNHDETDGFDECFVIKGAYNNWEPFIDDDMCIALKKHKSKKVTVISDCCHSGTICDIEPRDDIVCISACMDHETAKQDYFERKGNGVFSYYFFKNITQNNSYKIVHKIQPKLLAFSQRCTISYETDKIF